MRRLAFYGKGGIGKSTVSSNIAYLYKASGKNVLQIGCDPKHDSAQHHIPADDIITAMDVFKERNLDDASDVFESVMMTGKNGVHCIEAGGPEPGTGCVGRAISLLLDLFDLDSGALDVYDVVIYDVLGDVVCGGFATPIRKGHAEELYVVSSGEPMSLYAANNIVSGFVNLASEGGCRIAGLVGNLRGMTNEVENLTRFAEAINLPLVATLPRNDLHMIAEAKGGTVCEMYPDSDPAQALSSLHNIIENTGSSASESPTPMSDKEWRGFLNAILESMS